MTSFPAIPNGARSLLSPIRFEGFDVSWAGASPREDLFAFGSEDGRILFADSDGVVKQQPQKATPSGETINGLSFYQRWMSVSTRNEVMLWTLPVKQGETVLSATIPFGAHGVIVGHNGYFLAPLGRSGLLFYQPKEGPEQAITISSGATENAYFYRLISLQAADGKEIVACAARRGGIAAMEFNEEDQRHMLSALAFNGLDVIDVCPLGIADVPEGAAALGRDGTIILFRDVLRDCSPVTVNYESIKGTAYRILIVRGYLFLLTSKGMYVIAGLIDRFLKSRKDNQATPMLALPMEAVDAHIGSEKWLWIVKPDGVLRLDVELLDHITRTNLGPGEFENLSPTSMTPDWQRQEGEQHSRPVVLAGVA